jgi:hypothetical protein
MLWSALRQLSGIGFRNPPTSDARCNGSAQRFFVVRPAFPARTQLVQLPADTIVACKLCSLPSAASTRLDRCKLARPAAGFGKFSLLARERARLNGPNRFIKDCSSTPRIPRRRC